VRAGCSLSPVENALLLLAIVRRHLRGLRLTLDPGYLEVDWGFTVQQAFEKLLKAWIVLADRRPPTVHDLHDLLVLQVFAVETRYEEGPFPLPEPREELLVLLEREWARFEIRVQALADAAG
jgi:hypothetical protein